MNKICTNLEQSKKLIELGIDRKSSDMYYWCGEDLRIGGYKAQDEDYDISAWSLTALLDILAKETHNIDEDGHIVLSSYKGNWWDLSPINCDSEEIKDSNSPLDAAFEMICWLKENGKI